MRAHRVFILVAALAIAGCSTPPAATITANPDPAHNARNALDWAGTYRGVLPCADCEGIETVIVLLDDGTYSSSSKYLGKSNAPFSEQGNFTWNEAGNTITLEGPSPVQYFVGENQLIHLARDGSRITGDLAPHYVLAKVADAATGQR
ncbi:copper resistance protein NlpE [Parahaliea aestuarii]|uniref:Copper resistance protein NlpE n=1 Tax=Parahaliea aestuarii TaxID=1852021 RepID=A0A5C9A5D3_9GAMM|nr:copper resistance protein NlpE [Parahaliea aestuarii]TXS94421.1 copper resistance protein NlpE [Parahaliea aestuarii]